MTLPFVAVKNSSQMRADYRLPRGLLIQWRSCHTGFGEFADPLFGPDDLLEYRWQFRKG
jgi:hypothetical protein